MQYFQLWKQSHTKTGSASKIANFIVFVRAQASTLSARDLNRTLFVKLDIGFPNGSSYTKPSSDRSWALYTTTRWGSLYQVLQTEYDSNLGPKGYWLGRARRL